MQFAHRPVLLEACMDGLNIRPDGVYVDGTAGGAGHSAEIARRLGDGGRLIALDKDPQALRAARERLREFDCAEVVESDFREMSELLERMGVDRVDGILLDLGVSSHQLDTPERGFSYHKDAPLDMRMSGEGATAGELLNTLPAGELASIFRRYGEEKFAMPIARAVERERKNGPIETTHQLVDIIRNAIPAAARREGGHPAKRVFQALRIEVNGELDALAECLGSAFERLRVGGRFCVITFHSLEDRMVKQSFAAYARGCTCPPDFPVCVCGKTPRAELINKKPIIAGERELAENPRSKSAKLRVLEKLREGE